jgi:uncharacterized damage-inducible protein DinB
MEMDRALQIEHFAAAGPKLRQSVGGLTGEDLIARPGPGKWSIHELVVHLTDMDAIAIDRMKRILTEDNPTLLNADENAYLANLFPHEQSFEDAALIFEVSRRQFARVLRRLPESAFDRAGTHSVRGSLTLADLLSHYNQHFDHHLKFLHEKRHRLKKPLSDPSCNR